MALVSAIERVNTPWPALPLDDWLPTYLTLHRWVQIVGKTRLGLAPFQNQYWHCAFYVTARGLTTSPMPYHGGAVEIDFDFLTDRLRGRASGGGPLLMPLGDDNAIPDFL